MEGEARNLLLVLVQDLKTAVVEGQAAPVTHHIFILRRSDERARFVKRLQNVNYKAYRTIV